MFKRMIGVFLLVGVIGSTVIAGGFGDALGGSFLGSMVGGMATNAARSEPKTIVVHQPAAGNTASAGDSRLRALEERIASLEARVNQLERGV